MLRAIGPLGGICTWCKVVLSLEISEEGCWTPKSWVELPAMSKNCHQSSDRMNPHNRHTSAAAGRGTAESGPLLRSRGLHRPTPCEPSSCAAQAVPFALAHCVWFSSDHKSLSGAR